MNKKGLDIDGVCLNFSARFIEVCAEKGIYLNVDKTWNFFDQDIRCYDVFKGLTSDFWLSLKRDEQSLDLNFTPTAYISHRSCPTEVTRQSLLQVGFPDAPVFHVHHTDDKVKIAKDLALDVFVDDRASTVLYFLENNMNALCLDKIYNEDYNLPRIYTLGELGSDELWGV